LLISHGTSSCCCIQQALRQRDCDAVVSIPTVRDPDASGGPVLKTAALVMAIGNEGAGASSSAHDYLKMQFATESRLHWALHYERNYGRRSKS